MANLPAQQAGQEVAGQLDGSLRDTLQAVVAGLDGLRQEVAKLDGIRSEMSLLQQEFDKLRQENCQEVAKADGLRSEVTLLQQKFDQLQLGEEEVAKLDRLRSELVPAESWITLNVGGKEFTTSRMTLTAREPESMLARWGATAKYGQSGVKNSR